MGLLAVFFFDQQHAQQVVRQLMEFDINNNRNGNHTYMVKCSRKELCFELTVTLCICPRLFLSRVDKDQQRQQCLECSVGNCGVATETSKN